MTCSRRRNRCGLSWASLYGKLTSRGSHLCQRLLSTTSSGWRLQGRHLTLGVNHRFSLDIIDTPTLLGFLDVFAVENISESAPPKLIHARTWRAGISTYRRIDPVVLSLMAAYRYAGSR